ncbi:MAG: hypothetical protein HRU15_08605 [Planctomycetes bacterium]|nr:hypothetical protein [Planctomycetota bacterium]
MKLLATLWLLTLLGCGVFVCQQLSQGYIFDSSVLSLLPDSGQTEVEQIAQQHLLSQSDRRVIFLIADNDQDNSKQSAADLVLFLRQSPMYEQVQGKVENTQVDQWQAYYYAKRYQLLSDNLLERLQVKDASLNTECLARLYSPLSSLFTQQILEDPLQLFFQWQLDQSPQAHFVVDEGWLSVFADGEHYRFISAILAGDPYVREYQDQVVSQIATAREIMSGDSRLLCSALILHAAHGAAQGEREMSTIGIGSFIGVCLLLIIIFRRPLAIVFPLLSIVLGCLFALAISLCLFDRLHIITLAFGAGLVGVAIDYSMHYLCACMPRDKGHEDKTVLHIIFPSLLLALLSSVCAYAAQALSPFPGLRQMAVFSACGLIGAWITVVTWMPLWRFDSVIPQHDKILLKIRYLLTLWPSCIGRRNIFLMLCLAVVAVIIAYSGQVNDNLRRLQTSPLAMIEIDKQVQGIIAAPSMSQYFIVHAETEELLLQKEELFSQQLKVAQSQDIISGYMASSQYVPSVKKQRENYQLVQSSIYAAGGLLDDFCAAGEFTELSQEMRTAFTQYVFLPIKMLNWRDQELSAMTRHLWLGKIQSEYYSLITVKDIKGSEGNKQLVLLALDNAAVDYVDRVANISAVLTRYRQQMKFWMLAAYGAVFMLLSLRYGRRAWRVMMAPALASIIVLAILTLCGIAVSIFHSLALLLVLGIGLDASIFLHDSQKSPSAWLAVSLSSLTTLLAFGLLALSSTPILQFFGITVLLGIICLFVLAPCFVVSRSSDNGL